LRVNSRPSAATRRRSRLRRRRRRKRRAQRNLQFVEVNARRGVNSDDRAPADRQAERLRRQRRQGVERQVFIDVKRSSKRDFDRRAAFENGFVGADDVAGRRVFDRVDESSGAGRSVPSEINDRYRLRLRRFRFGGALGGRGRVGRRRVVFGFRRRRFVVRVGRNFFDQSSFRRRSFVDRFRFAALSLDHRSTGSPLKRSKRAQARAFFARSTFASFGIFTGPTSIALRIRNEFVQTTSNFSDCLTDSTLHASPARSLTTLTLGATIFTRCFETIEKLSSVSTVSGVRNVVARAVAGYQ